LITIPPPPGHTVAHLAAQHHVEPSALPPRSSRTNTRGRPRTSRWQSCPSYRVFGCRAAGAERIRSRGYLDEERWERSGFKGNIPSRCGLAPSLEIRWTERLCSSFSLCVSPSPSRHPHLSPLSGASKAMARGAGGARARACPRPADPARVGGARPVARSSHSALLCG
jgi:hypothetical protein